jgi:hypothetical protein
MMGDQKKLIFTDILCRVEMAELRLRSNNCLNLSVFLAIKCQNVLPDMELQWMSSMWVGLEVDRMDMEEPRINKGAVCSANCKYKEKLFCDSSVKPGSAECRDFWNFLNINSKGCKTLRTRSVHPPSLMMVLRSRTSEELS